MTTRYNTQHNHNIQKGFFNIPVPAPMEVKGDLLSNWAFFKYEWEDYEVATGLREKSKNVRVATLRSVMGRDCFRILKNL